jgi:hypothetical protein
VGVAQVVHPGRRVDAGAGNRGAPDASPPGIARHRLPATLPRGREEQVVRPDGHLIDPDAEFDQRSVFSQRRAGQLQLR